MTICAGGNLGYIRRLNDGLDYALKDRLARYVLVTYNYTRFNKFLIMDSFNQDSTDTIPVPIILKRVFKFSTKY